MAGEKQSEAVQLEQKMDDMERATAELERRCVSCGGFWFYKRAPS